MSKIDYVADNQTLSEIDKALELQQQLERPRNYLGMSIIGHECWRKLFYDFRGVCKRKISASSIRAINDGFKQEDIMAERLRMLPYIELHTCDTNNPTQQIAVEGLLSHFRGHLDGVIKGLKEAPTTYHVWENKAVNQKKFDLLNKLKIEKGEKEALYHWDQIYYAQAQCYCHFTGLERHFLTVETPGGREYTSVRTNYNRKYAEMIIDKARQIIFENFSIPEKISEKREFYLCNFCDYKSICHDGEVPDINCKTCRYRDPIDEGKSKCLATDTIIEETLLNVGCVSHIYNPALMPECKLVEHQSDGCIYHIPEKNFYFANTNITGFPDVKGQLDAIFTSKQLKEEIKNINNLGIATAKIQKAFIGEISPKAKPWDSLSNDHSKLRDI